MEKLPGELCLKIFHFLDHQSIATAIHVCRRWRRLASDNELWRNLFRERWGGESASFYAPQDSKSWKDVYVVQDRCDRYGLSSSSSGETSSSFEPEESLIAALRELVEPSPSAEESRSPTVEVLTKGSKNH